jgi:hypothetical protein
MHKAEIIFIMEVKAGRNPAELLQPRKQPLNFPSALIAPEWSAVLRPSLLPVRLVRGNHFNALLSKFSIKRVRVVSLIADQPCGTLGNKTLKESFSDKGDFMRRSTLRVDGEWKTSTVCHCHELRAFTALGLTNSPPPFFATINVPSMKHSDRSISPRVLRSSASASRTRRNVPSRDHCWNLRWQVWYGGNRSGKSCQRAPLRRIQSTPFITSRVSRHGRPFPSSRRGGSGISGPIIAHCSAVSSSPRLFAMR